MPLYNRVISRRIVVHRSENELNKAMGSASVDPKIPKGKTGEPKTSIYPLLNNVYEEVGSVELDIEWGHPSNFLSQAKMESIIHRSSDPQNGTKISSLSSFSVDDWHNSYEDPIAKVRKSMQKNKSWMSEINESLSRHSRPSRFGGTDLHGSDQLSPPMSPKGAPPSSPNPFNYEDKSFALTSDASQSVFERTGVRPPVAFEVDVKKGDVQKAKKGGGFFSRGGARSTEANFLKSREGEWNKLRQKKNVKIDVLREKKRNAREARRQKTLQQRLKMDDRIAKIKIAKKDNPASGRREQGVEKKASTAPSSKKAFSDMIAGKVNDAVIPKGKNKKGGRAKASLSEEEKKNDTSPAASRIKGGRSRETKLGVFPLDTALNDPYTASSKEERAHYALKLVKEDERKRREAQRKLKDLVARQRKAAADREERRKSLEKLKTDEIARSEARKTLQMQKDDERAANVKKRVDIEMRKKVAKAKASLMRGSSSTTKKNAGKDGKEGNNNNINNNNNKEKKKTKKAMKKAVKKCIAAELEKDRTVPLPQPVTKAKVTIAQAPSVVDVDPTETTKEQKQKQKQGLTSSTQSKA